MHFSFQVHVILLSLFIVCNGQFKIIGLLDTKSEHKDGALEKMRSLDKVLKEFPQIENEQVHQERDSDQEIDIPKSVIVNKENLNFIKPYDGIANDWKNDNVEVTSEGSSTVNNSIKMLMLEATSENDGLIGNSDGKATNALYSNEVEMTTTSRIPTSTILSNGRAYRKTFVPNIRKFSYIEPRHFHHEELTNKATSNTRWNNNKFIKVLKYRNKYKSKCRCERIWNCPKIQISIQRCAPDYFMCCF